MSVCSLHERGRLPTPPGERTAVLIIREGGDRSPAVRLQTASEKPSTYTEKPQEEDCFRPCRGVSAFVHWGLKRTLAKLKAHILPSQVAAVTESRHVYTLRHTAWTSGDGPSGPSYCVWMTALCSTREPTRVHITHPLIRKHPLTALLLQQINVLSNTHPCYRKCHQCIF